MMRILVGAACLMVLAAGAYFFWGEWQASRQRIDTASNAAARIEQARADIARAAGASQVEEARLRDFCDKQSDSRYAYTDDREKLDRLLDSCRILSFD